jgi:hypothetical protein
MRQGHAVLGQGDPRGSQQRTGLPLGELQLRRPDFGQLTGQPQSQIVTGGKHRVRLRWKAYQQPRQLRHRLGRAQLVQVVDD